MSQTIDSKVVEISFDNSNFEKNVNNSITTIDKLKKSLNFDRDNLKKIDIDVGPITSSFEKVDQTIEALKNKFSVIGVAGMTIVSNITTTMMDYTSRAIGYVTDSVVKGGINRAMNLENARFQLQGLLNDAEEVDKILGKDGDVEYGVKDTAYGLDAAAKVAAQLAASGYRSGDGLRNALRGISGVAAMTNSTYEDIGMIYTRIAGQGRLYADDLNSFAARGLNAAAKLGDVMGYTEEEIRSMVHNGEISFDQFSAAMDYAFGEHAKRANETFNGAMANIKAALSRVGALFVSPIIAQNSPFVELFNAIRLQVDSLKKEIEPLATSVTNFLNDFAGKLADTINNFSIPDFIEKVKEKIKSLNIDTERLGKTFDGFKAIFDIFIGTIKRFFSRFNEIVSTEGFTTLINGFLGLTAAIGDFLRGIADKLFTEKTISIFSLIIQGLSDFIVGVKDLFATFSNVFSGIKNVIVEIVTTISEAFKGLMGWLHDNTNPVDIITAIAALDLASVFSTWADLADKARKAFEAIYNVLSGKGGGLFGMLFGENPVETAKNFKEALETIGDSIKTFISKLTDGVKIVSLVSVALALGLMTSALSKLATLSDRDLLVGALALSAVSTILVIAFKRIVKGVGDIGTIPLVKMGAMLALFATAVNILAAAVKRLGGLDLPTLAKGVGGISVLMVALSGALKLMQTKIGTELVPIKIKDLLALLTFASVCMMLADAIKKVGELSLEAGLRGFLLTIGSLVSVIYVMDEIGYKLSRAKSLFAAIVLKVFVSSLDDIANALSKIGALPWGNIARGLVGMGGALTELGFLVTAFGKFIERNSTMVFGAIAFKSIVSSLEALVEAFTRFSLLSVEQMVIGAAGMGLALTELDVFIDKLGNVLNKKIISTLVGSYVVIQLVSILEELAKAFSKFGYLNLDQVVSAAVGMELALLEVSEMFASLGKITKISGIIGSFAIKNITSSLMEIAEAFSVFASFDIYQIVIGAIGFGAALAEVAAAIGLLGRFAHVFGIIGAMSLSMATGAMMDLALAFQKFGEMDLKQSGQAFLAMLEALGALAAGSIINIFSGLASVSISKVAKPLGDLADSAKKWEGVSIDKKFVEAMDRLAVGVGKFWDISDANADVVVRMAEPIGVLADSLRKWIGLEIPEDIKDRMANISEGISVFKNAVSGVDVIVKVAEPLAVLADSMNRWANVKVPENLADSLKQVAGSLTGLSFTFIGGSALNTIAEPIGTLADSISKWNDVRIPEGLGQQLSLFFQSFDYSGSVLLGLKLSSMARPLGDFADSIAKWQDLKVPVGLGEDLNAFALDIDGFASMLKEALSSEYGNIGSFASALSQLEDAVDKVTYVDMDKITSFITGVSGLAEGLNLNVESFSGLASEMLNSVNELVNTIVGGIDSRLDDVRSKGKELVDALAEGFADFSSTFDLLNKNLEEVLAIVNSYSAQFETAGANIVSGLKRGIENNADSAVIAAREMSDRIIEETKRALDERSPSHVFEKIGEFIPKGMAIGINSFSGMVVNSVKDLSSTAISGTKAAISKLSNAIQNDIDAEPTIRPVLDLTNIYSGINEMNGLINGSMVSEVSSIGQNGVSGLNGKNVTYQLVLDGAVYNDVPQIEMVVGSAFEIMGRYRGMNYG